MTLPPRLPEEEPPDGHPGEAFLREILKHNRHFMKTHGPEYFERFREEQHPRATLVTCADSRVHTHLLDPTPDDEIYVVRNIGNQVDSAEGSVAYGARHLHTPLLLVVGHVRCGALHAARSDYSDEPPAIRHELDGLHLSLMRAPRKDDPGEQWRADVIENVHQQVHDALQEYQTEVKAGRLMVVGAVYDFTGELGHGQGRLLVINTNGTRHPPLEPPGSRREH